MALPAMPLPVDQPTAEKVELVFDSIVIVRFASVTVTGSQFMTRFPERTLTVFVVVEVDGDCEVVAAVLDTDIVVED